MRECGEGERLKRHEVSGGGKLGHLYLFAFSSICLYENKAFRKVCEGHAPSEQRRCLLEALAS